MLRTAENKLVKPLGSAFVDLRIGTHRIKCPVLVVNNLPKAIILGIEFMKQYRVIIDYNQCRVLLHVGYKTLRLPIEKGQNNVRKCANSRNASQIPLSAKRKWKLSGCKAKYSQCLFSLIEKKGNLFDCASGYAFAHCVAEDLRMGAGIAVEFKSRFGGLSQLKRQNPTVGSVLSLVRDHRRVYYLVTKKNSSDKPTYHSLKLCLKALRNKMEQNKEKYLAIPMIGCGLDGLNENVVKNLIKEVFCGSTIQVSIYFKTDAFSKSHIYSSPIIKTDNEAPDVMKSNKSDTFITEVNRLSQIEFPGENVEPRVKLILVEDVVIDAKCQEKVKISVYGISPTCLQNFHLIGNDDLFKKKGVILEETGLELENGISMVAIFNSKAHKIKLLKGSCIGFLVQSEEILYVQKSNLPSPLCNYKINEKLTTTQKSMLTKIITDFQDVFTDNPSGMGFNNEIEHEIELEPLVQPIKCRPYRVSAKEKEIVNNQVQEMLKHNIIRPSKSPWASPVVLVKKKDQTWRFCVDYRKLNAVTKKNNYPLPLIDDLLNSLGNAKYFSSLDLFSGYWQIGVKESDKERTAFITHEGLYEFNVLPFGLCNAPSTFQNLTDRVFAGLKWTKALVYLDDVIVFSSTFEEHIVNLKLVLSRLREANLTAKVSKCVFAENRIKILGHVVDENGISTDPDKINAITNFPRLNSVKKLQSFLGLCNYYRKFIRDFSALAKPLFNITKDNVDFKWDSIQEMAFQNLKDKLASNPVLAHFNPNKECELRVDASREGLGAILLQEKDKELHPVSYISRSLTKAERNYTISELEALTVVWSLQYLRHLVYGRPIKIVTDHHALCWLKSCKDPTGRLARWAIKLSEYEYTVVHKNGRLHNDVDCLSRYPAQPPNENDEWEALEVPTFIMDNTDLQNLQKSDTEITKIIHTLNNANDINISQAMRRRAKNFILIDGILYKRNPTAQGLANLLVVPKCMISDVLSSNHSEPLAGHLGITKTRKRIMERFYWVGADKDIIRFIRSCPDCQARKGPTNLKPSGLLQPIKVGKPFDKIGIDLLGPFPRSSKGKTMIVVATDYATRYAETAALSDGKAERVANFLLNNVITRHGCPRYMLSDRGTVFRSEMIMELQKIMGIKPLLTTSYHPSCNGLTERLNKTLADMLSMYIGTSQKDWCQYLNLVTFAYNTAAQETTKMSPFSLVYAREPTLPSEAELIQEVQNQTIEEIRNKALIIRNQAVENINKKQIYDKERYDNLHRSVEFKKGDKVKLFTPIRKVGKSEKLLLRWFGPYEIIAKQGEVDYLIRLGTHKNSKTDIVHVGRLAPYYDPWTPNSEPVTTQNSISDDDQE